MLLSRQHSKLIFFKKKLCLSTGFFQVIIVAVLLPSFVKKQKKKSRKQIGALAKFEIQASLSTSAASSAAVVADVSQKSPN